MKKENRNIINNIRYLMEGSAISISELSRLSGVQRVALSRTLSGLTEPQDATLAKIAKVFKKSVSFLKKDPEANRYPSLDYDPESGEMYVRIGGPVTDPVAILESFKKDFPDAVMGSDSKRAQSILAIQSRLAALNERELRLVDGFIDDLLAHGSASSGSDSGVG